MKIGLIQLTSVLDYNINLEKIRHYAREGKKLGVKTFFLPEGFYSLSDGLSVTPHYLAKGNEHEKNVLKLAKDEGVALLGGSVIYRVGDKFFNRALFISSSGEIMAYYDKIHLFYFQDKSDPKARSYHEANLYTAGSSLTFFPWKDSWKIGASICYDLRFPELYRSYGIGGANLLTVASAFTVPTGKAHWHALLKARAIENLSYVVACAQWGVHNDRITTYGHSLVVSPWGEVVLDMGEGEHLKTVELKMSHVESARNKLSSLHSNFL